MPDNISAHANAGGLKDVVGRYPENGSAVGFARGKHLGFCSGVGFRHRENINGLESLQGKLARTGRARVLLVPMRCLISQGAGFSRRGMSIKLISEWSSFFATCNPSG